MKAKLVKESLSEGRFSKFSDEVKSILANKFSVSLAKIEDIMDYHHAVVVEGFELGSSPEEIADILME